MLAALTDEEQAILLVLLRKIGGIANSAAPPPLARAFDSDDQTDTDQPEAGRPIAVSKRTAAAGRLNMAEKRKSKSK
jgi:hypothetical protein